MRASIAEIDFEGKLCQHLDVGMVQEVIAPELIAELLETYQKWEEREQKTNMVSIVYWLIALHVSPRLSQRRVYGKLVSGLRTVRDDVAEQIPARSAFSYRREQLGSELLQELFARCAGPQASEQTPGAFWKGMRLLALDGTVESVPDTPANRAAFRYSSDDPTSHSPFPQARLVRLVECGTHLISYTFSDPRIPGAGEQVSRLVTTLVDPFLYPAKDLAVLYHERWRGEVVMDEARTHLRLSARTLRSLTPDGVIQELYALLLAHLVVRTLMLTSPRGNSALPKPSVSWMKRWCRWGSSSQPAASIGCRASTGRSASSACRPNGCASSRVSSSGCALAMSASSRSIGTLRRWNWRWSFNTSSKW